MAFNAESFQISLQNPLDTSRFAVEKITNTFLGQDNKVYYKVRWQETWEPEERLMALCAPLINEFWKEYCLRTQQQQQQQQPQNLQGEQNQASTGQHQLQQNISLQPSAQSLEQKQISKHLLNATPQQRQQQQQQHTQLNTLNSIPHQTHLNKSNLQAVSSSSFPQGFRPQIQQEVHLRPAAPTCTLLKQPSFPQDQQHQQVSKGVTTSHNLKEQQLQQIDQKNKQDSYLKLTQQSKLQHTLQHSLRLQAPQQSNQLHQQQTLQHQPTNLTLHQPSVSLNAMLQRAVFLQREKQQHQQQPLKKPNTLLPQAQLSHLQSSQNKQKQTLNSQAEGHCSQPLQHKPNLEPTSSSEQVTPFAAQASSSQQLTHPHQPQLQQEPQQPQPQPQQHIYDVHLPKPVLQNSSQITSQPDQIEKQSSDKQNLQELDESLLKKTDQDGDNDIEDECPTSPLPPATPQEQQQQQIISQLPEGLFLQTVSINQPSNPTSENGNVNQQLAQLLATSSATSITSEHQSLSHPQQQAILPLVASQVQFTSPTLQQISAHIPGFENYRLQINNSSDKKNLFFNPRFLPQNAILGARFQFIPNITHSKQPVPTEEGNVKETKDNTAASEEGGTKTEDHTCSVCQKVLSSKQYLKRHEAVHHSLSVLSCNVCNKYFDKKTALNRHMLSHNSDRPHVCEECGKGFKEKSNLTKHMVIHTGARPHQCDVCKAQFRQLGHLLKHLLVHKPDKPHKCTVCMKGFKRKEHLKDHMIIHSGSFPHECEICKKKFRFKTNLRVHIAQHGGKKEYNCDICDKAFSGKANLTQHRLIHNPVYDFTCEVCNKQFKRKGHLRRHMDIHKNDRLLTCIFCKEDFPNRAAYRKHLLLHTGSKPFVCTTCEKRFTSKSCLTQHMLTHSNNDTLFECGSCDKKFKSQTSLNKHMSSHEVVKDEEQNTCKKCKRVFKNATNLQKHEVNCAGTKKEAKKVKNKTLSNDNAEMPKESDEKAVPGKAETQIKPRKKRKSQKTNAKDENSNVIEDKAKIASDENPIKEKNDDKLMESSHQTIDMSVLRTSQSIEAGTSPVSSINGAITFNLLSRTSSHM